MNNLENISNSPEKEDKLKSIPNNADDLSVEEAFKHKHVVFEINECFEKTNINLFDNFVSSYTASYEASPEEQERIRQKLQDNIYAVRFDPAFFLLHESLASYIPELKTMFFPDMKSYKNVEVSLHEITHSIGSIINKADGTKIENYETYKELNEGITEKITVEITGNKKEEYSPNVKCVQIIDMIIGGKVNEAFQKNDINQIREAYDKQVLPGSFEELAVELCDIRSTFKKINKDNITVFEFEGENDVNSIEFIKNYDSIKEISNKEENLRLNYLKEKTLESKEKYLSQADKSDEDLKQFKVEVVNYVLAKESLSKYDNGKNLNLICEELASTLNKHFHTLIDKSNDHEGQIDLAQKICNIQASFDFSENKIDVLEDILKNSLTDLYVKMTNKVPGVDLDIYKKLGIKHNLKWLNNVMKK